LVSVTWVSNVLGTVNPLAQIAADCKRQGVTLVVDAAQAAPHFDIRADQVGCDFLAFSGHKMLGPTGIGVLWGTSEALERLGPCQYGGSMVAKVERHKTTFAPLPQRLEAGTPPIAEAIGLGAAIDYLRAYGMVALREKERMLLAYALEQLKDFPGLLIAGPADPEQQVGVVSFLMEAAHPHDVATILDRRGICVRAGHHCCQPLMAHFTKLWKPGSRAPLSLVRASFYLYNTKSDIDHLIEGLNEVKRVFQR